MNESLVLQQVWESDALGGEYYYSYIFFRPNNKSVLHNPDATMISKTFLVAIWYTYHCLRIIEDNNTKYIV